MLYFNTSLAVGWLGMYLQMIVRILYLPHINSESHLITNLAYDMQQAAAL